MTYDNKTIKKALFILDMIEDGYTVKKKYNNKYLFTKRSQPDRTQYYKIDLTNNKIMFSSENGRSSINHRSSSTNS